MNYDTEIQIHKNSIGSKTKLQESLLEAVQILHDGFIVNEKIPKTLECRIADDSKKDEGIYIVDYMNNKFEVNCFLDETFNVNDIVCVLVPDGDFAKTKIIIGSSDGSGEAGDQATKTELNEAVTTLQENFQAGVEAIGAACTRKGSPPASSSLEDTITAIDAIETGGNYMTKEITQDGIYNASDDNVDAYDHVIVAVRGGLRPHTVTFLAADEETVLEVVNDVPWGGGATYHGIAPTSSGMRFVGQSPNPTYVTEDLWCRPRFENISYSPDQILDDWVTIARHCEQDPDYYPTGMWKTLGLQNGVNIRMQLVAKEVDPLEGNNGYANTTQVAMNMYHLTKGFSDSGDHYADTTQWETDALREYLNSIFLNTIFPSELLPYVKNVIKYSSGYVFYKNAGTVTKLTDYPTLDKIWIPSAKECFNTYENLGTFYDVAFGANGVPDKNARKRLDQGGQNVPYWYGTRSGYAVDYYFTGRKIYAIYSQDGEISYLTPTEIDSRYTSSGSVYFLPCFCL